MHHDTAWLFPGQGSQEVGMGRSLAEAHPAARHTFEEADALLGFPLSALMFEGPKEALDATLNTQPALYCHSVALVRTARATGRLPEPAWLAGHSLGEYSALTASGALPFAAGLWLVRERGRLMAEAGARAPGGMAALLGLDDAAAAQLCAEASREGEPVQVANFNCPGQLVISGARAAVERASERARHAGARRVVPLDVSIAAHSPLMAEIQAEFAALIAALPLHAPTIPVIANSSAQPMHSTDEIRAELVAQLTGSVRWTETIRFLLAQGVQRVIELGPGDVLTGLVKRIERSSVRRNVGTWDELTRDE